ncbi:hypothetical protein KY290_010923 [Solanum tuberosum]|uniref:Uncharacterized protein n=1 Tax=Solanum tuberosum TaxID=4113 RepID=A0ABQ7VZ62_SOLTU|nr:hypothetical protein KY290_010923 [Solanum tuberosum]
MSYKEGGTDNTEGWLYRAERYFAFLGFAEEYWLPFPFFYFDGEALTRDQITVYPVEQTTVPSSFQTSFYHTVDAWDLTNGGITRLVTFDNIVTPQNRRFKTTTALVHEPSVVTKDPVFAEISCKTASSNFDDCNASVHEEQQSALVVAKVSDTSICGNDNLPPEVTIQVLDESSHNI